MVLFFFPGLLASTNPTMLYGAMLEAFILYLFLFRCFTLLMFVVPSQISDMNNSFRIMFIKISIIKVMAFAEY